MYKISTSVKKTDHDAKISGQTLYVDDIPSDGMLFAKMVRSEKAKARIINVEIPKLADGCYSVDYRDVPHINRIKIIMDDQPIFAENIVNYIGEAIVMIIAPTQELADTIASKVKVVYEELDAHTNLRTTKEVAHEYEYEKGDWEKAFEKADRIIEEEFYTAHQEQAYIETQGIIADYKEGKIDIMGSLQCPYYVYNAIKYAFGLSDEQVRVRQCDIGGAFGGKEDYPSVLACQVATAAFKIGKPVRFIIKRREDMVISTKRHPSLSKYRTALDKNGNILGMDIDVKYNGGAYPGLSSVVLQRGIICSTGVYTIPAIHVKGAVMITNTVPNGAFRGFGAPQTSFCMESHMSHIAQELGEESLNFKMKYFAKQWEKTATGGQYKYPIFLNEMVDRICSKSNYYKKREAFKNQKGRYRKGIGCAAFLHGCGFTGSAESDHIKAVVHLVKKEDDTVEIRVSSTDMGQGIRTTLSKVAAAVLDMPLDKVITIIPDTDICPDSGPTVASRSLMVVGRLIERAAEKLRDEWESGKFQIIEEHYKVEADTIPWNMDKFEGDAYPTFSWGVYIVELEVDTLIGDSNLKGVWAIYDVGTAGDYNIMRGQMEGGILQSIAHASFEEMTIKENGEVVQKGLAHYMIPTAVDTVKFDVEFIDNPYEWGPFGVKGAGELPCDGGAPAYTAAVENALGVRIYNIPAKPEDIIEFI